MEQIGTLLSSFSFRVYHNICFDFWGVLSRLCQYNYIFKDASENNERKASSRDLKSLAAAAPGNGIIHKRAKGCSFIILCRVFLFYLLNKRLSRIIH